MRGFERQRKEYALIGHDGHLNRVLVQIFDESAKIFVVVWRVCVVRCSRGCVGARLAKCLLIRCVYERGISMTSVACRLTSTIDEHQVIVDLFEGFMCLFDVSHAFERVSTVQNRILQCDYVRILIFEHK